MKHPPATAGNLQRRFLGVTTGKPVVDLEGRTCELSFSSAEPVERAFGIEVLSHKPGAADLTRLNSGAPLLFNHDMNDILGVVERAYIANGKGRAVVRFGKDQRGEWAMQQAADGVLVNVSFTYRVIDFHNAPDGAVIADTWEAIEISLVTVPADKSVGIGRTLTPQRNQVMPEITDTEGRLSRSQRAQVGQQNLQEQTRAASDNERGRVLEIAALGRRYGLDESDILDMQQAGTSVEDARARTMRLTQASVRARPISNGEEVSGIGLSDNETQSFSLVRAINAVITGDWTKAGLERAASRAMEVQFGKQTQGFFVPKEVMQRGYWGNRLTYKAGVANTGGDLVGTSLLDDQFIEVMRNQAMVVHAGATVMSGLVGNVDIPRQTSQTATTWVGESGDLTKAEATVDKVMLRPKTIGAFSQMSRLMLLQSTPAIELLCRSDLIASLGLGVDLAALSGAGSSNQPTGIVNQAGLSFISLGVNGGAVDLDTLVELETVLNNGNGSLSGRAYFVNAKTAGRLKKLKATSGQYLWTESAPGQRSMTPATFNGYPVYVTNQVRSNLVKGTSGPACSELFFGSWPDLMIGQWGTLEVTANEYDSQAFRNGDVLIRAMQTVDIGLRRPSSFVICTDALNP